MTAETAETRARPPALFLLFFALLTATAARAACPKGESRGEDGLVWTYEHVTNKKKGRDVCAPNSKKFPDKAVLAAVNTDLAVRLVAAPCDEPAGGTKPAGRFAYEVRPVSTFAKGGFFGVTAAVYVDCGGAHPDGYTQGLTYDLTTGKRVAFGDAFKDKDDRQELTRAAVKANPNVTWPVADCKGLDIAGENHELDYALAPDGVDLWPSLPHAVAVCSVPLRLSWKQLAPFLADKSPLKRLLK